MNIIVKRIFNVNMRISSKFARFIASQIVCHIHTMRCKTTINHQNEVIFSVNFCNCPPVWQQPTRSHISRISNWPSFAFIKSPTLVNLFSSLEAAMSAVFTVCKMCSFNALIAMHCALTQNWNWSWFWWKMTSPYIGLGTVVIEAKIAFANDQRWTLFCVPINMHIIYHEQAKHVWLRYYIISIILFIFTTHCR